MFRYFQIMIFAVAIISLAGCTEPIGDDSRYTGLKIGDLAPANQPVKTRKRLKSGEEVYVFETPKSAKTPNQTIINLTVYIFETPAENAPKIIAAAKSLSTRQIRLNCPKAFAENGFSAALGRGEMWNDVAKVLQESGSKKINTITMLLQPGYPEDVHIALLKKRQSIFHISCQSRIEGSELDVGRIVMEVKVSDIPEARGMAMIELQPMWSSLIKKRLADIGYINDVLFLSAGLSLPMTVGDLIFLTPTEFRDERASLSALFFSRPGKKPVIRTYLIACREISE